MKTYEVKQTAGVLLNANESPFPLPAMIREEVKVRVDDIDFHRYPQDSAKALRAAYGSYLHINADQILFGNGSDEMIGFLIGHFIHQGKCVYTLQPDFSMYDYYTAIHDGKILTYPCDGAQPFSVSDFITYGKQNEVDLILFSNPNNPTGRWLAPKEIHQILDAFPTIPIIVDEAYGEFAPASIVHDVDQYENLIVLRTLSKAFGIAALRCGCMITNLQRMKQLRPHKVPYNVNSLTQMIAELVLTHHEIMAENVKTIIGQRELLYKELQAFSEAGLTIFPSEANFLYGKTARKHELFAALKKHQIYIRDYANSDAFRITIGTPDENKMMIETFAEVFSHKEDL